MKSKIYSIIVIFICSCGTDRGNLSTINTTFKNNTLTVIKLQYYKQGYNFIEIKINSNSDTTIIESDDPILGNDIAYINSDSVNIKYGAMKYKKYLNSTKFIDARSILNSNNYISDYSSNKHLYTFTEADYIAADTIL